MSADQATADAFANSWNHLPAGSVYTRQQFEDWFAPLRPEDLAGREVLELGCGNGSLLVHVAACDPQRLVGVDLGSSARTARENLAATGFARGEIVQADLTEFSSNGFEVVYCIGVLHHLQEPARGFAAVLRNTAPGGRFHCWVYAREGNALIIALVDPIRRVASRLPWWLTKHLLAPLLVAPYFLYARALAALRGMPLVRRLPLFEYSCWIARREFGFFRHVAFDQLVTPRTVYLSRRDLESWFAGQAAQIEPGSTYLIFRNGNSWKFGGVKRFSATISPSAVGRAR